MNEITIYTPTGEITRWVSCNESEFEFQISSSEEAFIPGHFDDQSFYIDIVSKLPIEKDVRPSQNHIFDYTLKQWIDPRTLQDFKDAQWSTIKQARTQAEYGGFTWDGSTFDSDATSQNRITGAVQLAQLSPDFAIDWTLENNTVRTLSAADMVAVGAALGVQVGAQFAKAQALRVQINAATTKEEVEAIVW